MSTFIGTGFAVQAASAIGLATIRVRYMSDPAAINPSDVGDGLNIANYELVGPTENYVTSASTVHDDPQEIDLYLAGALSLGTWTLTVRNVQSVNADALEDPTSATFDVITQLAQTPLDGGARNDDVVNVLRKFLSPALKGKGWDSMLAGLAEGDATNWVNAKLAFDQLFISSATGPYLARRAAEQGYQQPANLAMPDELFRRLAIISRASKLTQNALLEVLEVYYGSEALRASMTSAGAEPYALEDGDDLDLAVDEREFITITFNRKEFARTGRASAVEVAAALTRDLRTAGSQAYAVAHRDEGTATMHVRIYSGRLGIASSIRVLGGRAQTELLFPGVFSFPMEED